MKIRLSQLKRIIKEEVSWIMNENEKDDPSSYSREKFDVADYQKKVQELLNGINQFSKKFDEEHEYEELNQALLVLRDAVEAKKDLAPFITAMKNTSP